MRRLHINVNTKNIINYGPLKSLLLSTDMSEVMVNSWDKVFVEHKGLLVQTAAQFIDEREYQDLIFAILLTDNKDYSNKFSFDGILPQGHRYNITLPPLTPKSPTLTIRKHSVKAFTFDDLVKLNFMCDKASDFLKSAIESRLTIIVSGGTGSGKTSFLNSMAKSIPADQRIVSIEDTQELRPEHPNWVHMLTIKKENQNFTARDCLTNALRMRPDRIVVGECRGPEAFDMLQAINTGHEGSMTTVHSNSANDCLARLETLITLGHSDISLKYIRGQMASAIDLVVQLRRHPDGHRQIIEILELTGMSNDIISRSNIFELNKKGHLDVTGYVPQCLGKMQLAGSKFKSQYFDPMVLLKKVG